MAVFDSIPNLLDKLRTRTIDSLQITDNFPFCPLLSQQYRGNGQTTDLNLATRYFLDHKIKQICVLFGDGGSGKSFFLRQFCVELWDNYAAGVSTNIPLYISLPSLRDPVHHLVDEYLKSYGFDDYQVAELKQNFSFVFLLDGYDEIHLLENLIMTNDLQHWNAKVIISCRTQYFYNKFDPTLYFTPFKGEKAQSQLLEVLYVSVFNGKQLQDYLSILEKEGVLVPSIHDIRLIPGLEEIITSPFLFRLMVETMPDLKSRFETAQKSTEETLKLTQTYLYKIFVDRWFARQETKLLESGVITKSMPDQKPIFWRYCQTLATKMHEEGVTWIDIRDSRFEIFFESDFETEVLRSACPLKEINGKIGFWHQSLGSFFLGQSIKEEELSRLPVTSTSGVANSTAAGASVAAASTTNSLEKPKGNIFVRDISGDIVQLRTLADYLETEPRFRVRLFDIISCSKTNVHYSIGAANAISALNFARVSFSGMDFRYIKIPNANLQGAILHYTDFTGADLRNVNLEKSFISSAKFDDCNMNGVFLGDVPLLAFPFRLVDIQFSSNNRWLAIQGDCRNSVIIKDCVSGKLKELQMRNRGLFSIVGAISFSPDSQILACATGDTVTLWQCYKDTDWKIDRELRHPVLELFCLQFSPDGRYLAAGGYGNHVIIWDFSTGYRSKPMTLSRSSDLGMFAGNSGNVWSVAFSPDSQILAAGGDSEVLRMWDTATCKPLKGREQLFGHENFINGLAFSPDGKLIASGSGDRSVRVWSVDTGMLLVNCGVLHHQSDVYTLAFSDDGKTLAVGCQEDKSIHLWQVSENRSHITKVKQLQGHDGTVQNVVFTQNGKQLVSCSNDGFVRLWTMDSELTGVFPNLKNVGHIKTVLSLCFTDDGKLISAGGDNCALIWTISENSPMTVSKTLQHHGTFNNWVSSVAISPDGKYLLTRAWDRYMIGSDGVLITRQMDTRLSGVVYLWSTEAASELIAYWPVISDTPHKNAVFSKLSYAAWGVNNCVQLVQLSDIKEKVVKVSVTLKGHLQEVQQVNFNPNGNLLLSGCLDGSIGLWDIEALQFLQLLTGHSSPVFGVTFNNSGSHFASTSGFRSSKQGDKIPIMEFKQQQGDFTVRVWNVSSQVEEIVLTGHTNTVLQANFSRDDQLLASGSADRSVRIWATRDWQLLQVVNIHSVVYCVAFGPRNILAVGSDDQSIRLFSRSTGNDNDMMGTRRLFLLQSTSNPVRVLSDVNAETAVGLSDDQRLLLLLAQDSKKDVLSMEEMMIKSWNQNTEAPATTNQLISSLFVAEAVNDEIAVLSSNTKELELKEFSQQVTLRSQGIGGTLRVMFSFDGKFLIAAEQNGTKVQLWSVESNQLLTTRGKFRGKLMDAVFSPNGKYIATSSLFKEGEEKMVDNFIWDVYTGNLLHSWTTVTGQSQQVCFSPDGKFLAWISTDAVIFVVVDNEENSSGVNKNGLVQPAHVISLQTPGEIVSMAFSPDSCLFAYASTDTCIYLRGLSVIQFPLAPLTGHTDSVVCMAFAPNGLMLASGGGDADPTVRLWELVSGGYIAGRATLSGHKAKVTGVAFNPDGQFLVSASEDKSIRIWKAEINDEPEFEQIISVIELEFIISSVCISARGVLAVGLSNSNSITLYIPKKIPKVSESLRSARPHENVTGIPGVSIQDTIKGMMKALQQLDKEDDEDEGSSDSSDESEGADNESRYRSSSNQVLPSIQPALIIRDNPYSFDSISAFDVDSNQFDANQGDLGCLGWATALVCCPCLLGCCPCLCVGTILNSYYHWW